MVNITVSVANTGGMVGSYAVVLMVNDAKEAEESVAVAAGDSKDVSFSISKEEAGSYSVTVDGLSDAFTVAAPPPTAPPPTPTEVTPAAPTEVEPGTNWPIVGGIIAAVVAGVVAGAVWYRRRRMLG